MENILGTKLADRYLIEELVGVGGMCNVYRAFDAEALRTVAVKMLRDEYAADEEYLRRFRNESRAINALSHPNIVKIYDVVLDVPNPYLVMEYVSGITLKEYIERKKPIPGKTAANIAGLVLTALQCAHENGIVHRDVKQYLACLIIDTHLERYLKGVRDAFGHTQQGTYPRLAVVTVTLQTGELGLKLGLSLIIRAQFIQRYRLYPIGGILSPDQSGHETVITCGSSLDQRAAILARAGIGVSCARLRFRFAPVALRNVVLQDLLVQV